tara:strand:+ start:1734 stop:2966 length:1233 start_codon:yes stop_codon:yes gene_type:complete
MSHEVPEGWEMSTFSASVDINPKRVIRKGDVVPFVDMASVPHEGATIRGFKERLVNSSGAKFQNGDTLFARITPCTENGKTGFVDFLDAGQFGCGSTELIVFGPKPGKTDPIYVYHLARSDIIRKPAIRNMIGTTGRQRVPNWVFDTISIAIPPLSEQKKIAEVLSSVDKAIAATKALIDQTKQVKKGLLQTLLTKGIGHTKFKQTELGEIPESWEIVELHKHCQVQGGYAFKSSAFQQDGIPLVRISNITDEGVVIGSSGPCLSEGEAIDRSAFLLQNGDILMALSGATTGKWGVFEGETVALLNQRVGRFKTKNTEKLSPSFLIYIVASLSDEIRAAAYGGAQPNISPKNIGKNKICLPPLSEQRAISDLLSASDNATKHSSLEFESLQELKSGLMSDLLTGRKRVKV